MVGSPNKWSLGRIPAAPSVDRRKRYPIATELLGCPLFSLRHSSVSFRILSTSHIPRMDVPLLFKKSPSRTWRYADSYNLRGVMPLYFSQRKKKHLVGQNRTEASIILRPLYAWPHHKSFLSSSDLFILHGLKLPMIYTQGTDEFQLSNKSQVQPQTNRRYTTTVIHLWHPSKE